MAKGTLRMRASVFASSVLPLPVGPIRARCSCRFSMSIVFVRDRGGGRGMCRITGGRLGHAQALVVIVHRHRQRLLGVTLPDDILIEEFVDLARAGNGW